MQGVHVQVSPIIPKCGDLMQRFVLFQRIKHRHRVKIASVTGIVHFGRMHDVHELGTQRARVPRTRGRRMGPKKITRIAGRYHAHQISQ